MSSHICSACLNHPDQNLPAHDEGRLIESAVAIWLVLAYLSVEIRLRKEAGIEFGDRRDNQMSEKHSLPARRHHPAKGSLVLGA